MTQLEMEHIIARLEEVTRELKKTLEPKKRYFKLLRDLPTFKAGDIMELSTDGCLYFDATKNKESRHYKCWIMVYHKNTLEAFPNILTDWYEEIKEEHATRSNHD